MPRPNNFGTMGEVNTTLSSDFTPPDIKKKKDADLPQIAGMCPGRKIGKPVETDVIPVINKGFPSRKPGGNFSTGDKVACKGFDDIEIKSLKDKVTAGAVGLTGGYVGSEIANRTQDARRHAENKQLTKEFEMADRGSASFIEMKEFMNADFVEKGGTSPETLPNEKGGDAAEQDKLTDVMNKKQPPKGGIKTEEPDLTMDPEVQMVADKAEDDITSGYVGDTQGAKVGKGFAAFNDLVAKGMVADVNINRYNVHDSVEKINEAADVTLKGCSNEGKKKAPPWLKTGK